MRRICSAGMLTAGMLNRKRFIGNFFCICQVCSAVQNQDFTVIQDYVSGLKALLYLKSNPPPNQPQNWDGQSPPIFKNQKGKPVVELKDENGQPLINFGVQKQKRDEETTRLFKEKGPFWKLNSSIDSDVTNGVANHIPRRAPSIKDITGISLPYIGAYKKLDNVKQVVALIDDVSSYTIAYEQYDMNSMCFILGIWMEMILIFSIIISYRICASIVVNVIWPVLILGIRPLSSTQILIGRMLPTIALVAICAYLFAQLLIVLGKPEWIFWIISLTHVLYCNFQHGTKEDSTRYQTRHYDQNQCTCSITIPIEKKRTVA